MDDQTDRQMDTQSDYSAHLAIYLLSDSRPVGRIRMCMASDLIVITSQHIRLLN